MYFVRLSAVNWLTVWTVMNTCRGRRKIIYQRRWKRSNMRSYRFTSLLAQAKKKTFDTYQEEMLSNELQFSQTDLVHTSDSLLHHFLHKHLCLPCVVCEESNFVRSLLPIMKLLEKILYSSFACIWCPLPFTVISYTVIATIPCSLGVLTVVLLFTSSVSKKW